MHLSFLKNISKTRDPEVFLVFKPYDVRPSAWIGRKCPRCDVASRLPQPADSLFANGESKGLNAGSKQKKKSWRNDIERSFFGPENNLTSNVIMIMRMITNSSGLIPSFTDSLSTTTMASGRGSIPHFLLARTWCPAAEAT